MEQTESPAKVASTAGLVPLPRLVACPLCGADKGYTLRDGSTYRWWIVSCAGCGNDLGECHADRTLKIGAAKPERWEWADEHWNQVGAYAQGLRDALVPLANAHMPIERECLTDEDCRRAQTALYGPNV